MIVMESYTRKDIEEQFLQAAGRGDLDAVGRMLSAGVFVDATDELFRQVGSLFDAFYRFRRLVISLRACMVPVRFKPVIPSSCPFYVASLQTALQKASYAGHVEVARKLLEAGASVNAAGRYGRSSLHRACVRGHVDCVRLLLNAGADVKAVNKGGWGSLHYAAYACQAECVSLLLEAGADPNFADRQGRTPLVRLLARTHMPQEDRERFHKTVEALVMGGSKGWQHTTRPYIFDLSQHMVSVWRHTPQELKHFFSGLPEAQKDIVRLMLLVLKRRVPNCEQEVRLQILQLALNGYLHQEEYSMRTS